MIDPNGPASCGMFCCLEALFRLTREAAEASRAAAEAAWKARDEATFNAQLELHHEQRRHTWALFARLDRMTAAWGGAEDDEAFLAASIERWQRERAAKAAGKAARATEEAARADEQGWRSAEGKAA